ncbi:unnamed protein product [Effrenium voratum]|nr:unnamed protein product [Effrenium voratum]
MRPCAGLCGELDDGILRGRVGAGRWLLQAGLVSALATAFCVTVIILLLSESLVFFIVTLFLAGLLFASLKFCLRPWAWLGVDSHLPILFDLQSSGLEVGTWDHCFLRRRLWPAARLKDLCVYKECVDSSETKASDPVPISSSEKVSAELPNCCDATKACFGSCWRSCCVSSSATLVSGVFLGAKLEKDVVRLSRNVWTKREVEELLVLAQRGRNLLGLNQVAPPDLEICPQEPMISPRMVVDLDTGETQEAEEEEGPSFKSRQWRGHSRVEEVFEALPTIREETSNGNTVTPAFSKEESAAAEDRQLSTVVRPTVAPRPKVKSQAKVQDARSIPSLSV